MRHSLTGLCVAAVMLAASGAAVAHHGAATFDTGKTLVLEGVVTEWVWANPHCFLKFEVKGADGTRPHLDDGNQQSTRHGQPRLEPAVAESRGSCDGYRGTSQEREPGRTRAGGCTS